MVGQPNAVHTPEAGRRVGLTIPRQQHLELAFRGGQADPNGAGVRIRLLQYRNTSIRKRLIGCVEISDLSYIGHLLGRNLLYLGLDVRCEPSFAKQLYDLRTGFGSVRCILLNVHCARTSTDARERLRIAASRGFGVVEDTEAFWLVPNSESNCRIGWLSLSAILNVDELGLSLMLGFYCSGIIYLHSGGHLSEHGTADQSYPGVA